VLGDAVDGGEELASGGNKYAVAEHTGHSVDVMDTNYAHVLSKQAQACADIMSSLLQAGESK